MIRHCYDNEKVKKIILGSGGSAFVDGGLGAMHALRAFDFYHKNGSLMDPEIVPTVT